MLDFYLIWFAGYLIVTCLIVRLSARETVILKWESFVLMFLWILWPAAIILMLKSRSKLRK